MNDSTTMMNEEEISLDRYFAAVWRAKWFILLLMIVAAGLAALLGLRQPTLHTATALIEVGRVWKEPLEDPYVTTEIANSQGFNHELAAKTGVRPNQLKSGVRAETVTAGPQRSRYPILVRITASTESEDLTAGLAQAMADELVARHEKLFEAAMAPHTDSQRRIEERLKDPSLARELAVRLESELDEIKSNNTSPTVTEKTHLLGPVVKSGVVRPSIWRGVAIATLLAALAGLAAAIVFGHFRPGQTGESNQANSNIDHG